ncbi:M1 family peptidase [Herbidospora sp. NEAU-GS84]|uniref:Aminopeptidase N n=1 Tax=Herbidospora solisilvae TaxID=2696284 RepID=A0A7C9N1J8_9ACTN|nr:M1 family metallopeptidase [Herbidospora solisilvae]NAS26691.1 M1 family peptidase [Herbidospora solisilvae]
MRLTRALSGALIVVTLTSCSPSGASEHGLTRSGTAGAAGIGDADFPNDGNGGYDVGHYTLALGYDPATRLLAGTATIDATATENLSSFNLDLRGFTVSSVTVGGRPAKFTRSGDEMTVTADLPKGSTFRAAVTYQGEPKPVRDSSNLGTYGFVPTSDGSFVTSEPNGAKTWFPGNDHPADKATYEFRLTVPDGVTAIANGELAGEPTSKGGKTTFVWRETHPMVSYLATMTTGKFLVKTGDSGGGIPVYAAVDPRYQNQLDRLYEVSARITDYWSSVFGPYPFKSTGGIVDDFASGYALENQTKPIYGGFEPDEGIISHELAHQWFGDSVSISRWKDLWLNEGFATYAEWLWSEHQGQATAQQTFDRHYANTTDPMWNYPPGVAQKNDLFNNSVYYRGAMALHALRVRVGDDAFFKIIRRWATEHRYGNATTEQFISLAEQVSGRKLGDLFDQWLFEKGRPATLG